MAHTPQDPAASPHRWPSCPAQAGGAGRRLTRASCRLRLSRWLSAASCATLARFDWFCLGEKQEAKTVDVRGSRQGGRAGRSQGQESGGHGMACARACVPQGAPPAACSPASAGASTHLILQHLAQLHGGGQPLAQQQRMLPLVLGQHVAPLLQQRRGAGRRGTASQGQAHQQAAASSGAGAGQGAARRRRGAGRCGVGRRRPLAALPPRLQQAVRLAVAARQSLLGGGKRRERGAQPAAARSGGGGGRVLGCQRRLLGCLCGLARRAVKGELAEGAQEGVDLVQLLINARLLGLLRGRLSGLGRRRRRRRRLARLLGAARGQRVRLVSEVAELHPARRHP